MYQIAKFFQFCVKHSAAAKADIMHLKNLRTDVITAAKTGKRRARIDNKSIFGTIGVTTSAVVERGLKPHLPGLFAGLGFCSPVPLGSAAGFGLGKVLQKII